MQSTSTHLNVVGSLKRSITLFSCYQLFHSNNINTLLHPSFFNLNLPIQPYVARVNKVQLRIESILFPAPPNVQNQLHNAYVLTIIFASHNEFPEWETNIILINLHLNHVVKISFALTWIPLFSFKGVFLFLLLPNLLDMGERYPSVTFSNQPTSLRHIFKRDWTTSSKCY